MIDRLFEAVEALNQGDPEPFASLFSEDAEWRGIPVGYLWWKRTPSCRGPDGARAALAAFLSKRTAARTEVLPKFDIVGDKIIGSTLWSDRADTRVERFQVLTIRDGKIVDMQGCRTRREAERFARRT